MIPQRTAVDVDQIARHLAWTGAIGANLPKGFRRHGISTPVWSIGGDQVLGRMCDGEGLYLDCDLRALGIHKPIPHVIERSPTQRILDRLRRLVDDRGAITTYDGIINAHGNTPDDLPFSKGASITTVANTFFSSFRMGGLPVAGTYVNIPGGAAPDKTNVGALSLGLTNPTGGNTKYLLTFGFSSSSAINMFVPVDLLVAAGNLSGSTNAAQTVNSVALTRYTTGAGVYMTFEVTTALGATPANLTVSYTNQSGVAGQTTPATAMTASCIAQRLQPATLNSIQMPLASGDTGVQSVQTATLSASMTAGVFALNIFRTLGWIQGVAANIYMERDTSIQISSLVPLPTASGNIGCLTVYAMANTTTSGTINGFLRTCQG